MIPRTPGRSRSSLGIVANSVRNNGGERRDMRDTVAEVERRIRAYLDHLEDGDYVRSIFALADVPTITDRIIAMVRHGTLDEVNDALLFVRDVVNYGMAPAFRDELPRSGLFAALADGILADRYAVRDACIYTLGKISFPENAPILARAFPRYIERDPLLLGRLITERFWLTHGVDCWSYLQTAAASSLYLSRWAALETTYSIGWATRPGSTDATRLEALYATLAADPHPSVRAEAARALAEPRLGRDGGTTARGARWQTFLPIRMEAARSSFLGLATLFRNYLSTAGMADYSVELFDTFARFRHDHPFRPPGTYTNTCARLPHPTAPHPKTADLSTRLAFRRSSMPPRRRTARF